MKIRLFFVFFLWMTLSACVGAQPGAAYGSGGQEPALFARQTTPEVALATQKFGAGKGSPSSTTPEPARPIYAEPAYTPAAIPGTEQPTDTPVPTPEDTLTPRELFSMCSPLYDIEREDLPLLVSDEYTAPPPRSDARHEGTDFAFYHWKGYYTIAGHAVTSILTGKVSTALNGTFPYGNFLIVETPYDWLSVDVIESLNIPPDQSLYLLYAHLQDGSIQVDLGEEVSACQIIAAVGKTGNTNAAHLHLETRIGPPGAQFTAMSAFTETATPEEKKNYRLWRVSWIYQHFDPMRLLGWGIPRWPTPTVEFLDR